MPDPSAHAPRAPGPVPRRGSPIRLGMITSWDLDDPTPLSGMPHHMAAALRAQGFIIDPISDRRRHDEPDSLVTRARQRLRAIRQRRTPLPLKRLADTRLPSVMRARVLRQITRRSAHVQANLEHLVQRSGRPDALFGCCISSALYALETDIPIVYFSDATLMIIKDTYSRLAARGPAFHETLHQIERRAVGRVARAVFASPITRRSAIDDLGADPAVTRVIPMGAHVVPEHPAGITAPASPPTREDCRLLVVAVDPIRKRVDLALDAAGLLRRRGINATLHIVGPGTPRSRASAFVHSHGRLNLGEPDHLQLHRKLLRACHLQLLPSIGEAFGIAPAESAHFARPSIVSDAGGLPFVVLHDQTGIVIDRHAGPAAWADAVGSLIDHPQTYRRLSTAALTRARAELNWDAWGRAMRQIIAEAIDDRRAFPQA